MAKSDAFGDSVSGYCWIDCGVVVADTNDDCITVEKSTYMNGVSSEVGLSGVDCSKIAEETSYRLMENIVEEGGIGSSELFKYSVA